MPATKRSARRVSIAQGLAAVGLLAAIVGALGPAERTRTTYSLSSANAPSSSGVKRFAPLLLLRHRPEALTARVPCAAAPDSAPLVTTARDPQTVGGLSIAAGSSDDLVFAVGAQLLGVRPQSAEPGCVYELRLDEDRFAISRGTDAAELEGGLDAMPVVTGLFAGDPSAQIEVTTAVHLTKPTLMQTLAWILAAAAIVAALVLLAVPGRPPRPWRELREGARSALSGAHLVDVVVAVSLLSWWILGPVFWDDGWVIVRERTFADSGGFSTFYNAFGVNFPLDYWVEWLQHWATQSSNALPLLRLPALACLATVWILCRWSLAQVTRATSAKRFDVALWALAAAFLAIAFAWGMTLRPEPVVALLTAASFACAIRFAERETSTPIVLSAALLPLAATAHHTGIAAAAPLLAVSPQLVRWARARLAVAVPIVVTAVAALVLLLFVGSDLRQRLDDIRSTSAYGITQDWHDELERYVLLDDFPFGPPLRRASVALLVLALAAYLLRRRRNGRTLLDLPATTLGLALLLFVATPSKLPWHFGALLGIAAVAAAAETARLRVEGSRSEGRTLWPVVALGVATVAAAWSWAQREPWNPLDLVTAGWTPGVDGFAWLDEIAVALPLVVLAGTVAFRVARYGRADGSAWRTVPWTAPLLVAPLLVFTTGTLVVDVLRTSSWTSTRQSLGALAGDHGCGLADDVVVSTPRSARPLARAGGVAPPPPPAWIPPPPVAGLVRFELRSGSTTSWFDLPAEGETGLFVAASAGAPGLELEWGRRAGAGIESLGSSAVTLPDPKMDTADWLFLAQPELPSPPPDATSVRVGVDPNGTQGAAIAVTEPVTYPTETLADRLRSPDEATIVHPNLFQYFPCAKQPQLSDGAVEPPRHIVWFDHPFQPHPYEPTSPFLGISDLYEVKRQPLVGDAPPGVIVFEVDPRSRGSREVQLGRSTR